MYTVKIDLTKKTDEIKICNNENENKKAGITRVNWQGDLKKNLKAQGINLNNYYSQGMAYYDNKLYMVYAEKKKFNNYIFGYDLNTSSVYNQETGKINKQHVTINEDDKKDEKDKNRKKHFEMESCVVLSDCIYFNTNCESKDNINYDSIYRIKRKF